MIGEGRRKTIYVLILLLCLVTFFLFVALPNREQFRHLVNTTTPKDDEYNDLKVHAANSNPATTGAAHDLSSTATAKTIPYVHPTRTLVVAHRPVEDVSWIEEHLGHIDWVDTAVYTLDDPTASLRPNASKGHETSVYLTFMLDNYDNFPEVAIFMHYHREAYHNNDLLESDAVRTVLELKQDYVLENGYVNTRCHWEPGCPADHVLHGTTWRPDGQKGETDALAEHWSELFPNDPVPTVLAQPCCAQFALSRKHLQSIPRATLQHMYDWLLHTAAPDEQTGRMFEYLWQYIFLKQAVVCPPIDHCYCAAYGICDEAKLSTIDHSREQLTNVIGSIS